MGKRGWGIGFLFLMGFSVLAMEPEPSLPNGCLGGWLALDGKALGSLDENSVRKFLNDNRGVESELLRPGENPLPMMEQFLLYFSELEIKVLVLRHGLDGKGTRSVKQVAALIGLGESSAELKVQALPAHIFLAMRPDLSLTRGFGPKTVEEVKEALAKHGMKLSR